MRHILDWLHLSMRVRPIEQVRLGLAARHRPDPEPVHAAQASIERIRHLLWHGRQEQADQELVLLLTQGAFRSEIASGKLQAWPLRARAFWHLTLMEAPGERRNEAASALSAMMRATVRDLVGRGYWPGSSQAD